MGWSPWSSPERASGTAELLPTRQRAGLRIFTSDFLYGGLACAPHLRTSENGCLPGVRTSGSPLQVPLAVWLPRSLSHSRLTPLSSGPAGRNGEATGLESRPGRRGQRPEARRAQSARFRQLKGYAAAAARAEGRGGC